MKGQTRSFSALRGTALGRKAVRPVEREMRMSKLPARRENDSNTDSEGPRSLMAKRLRLDGGVTRRSHLQQPSSFQPVFDDGRIKDEEEQEVAPDNDQQPEEGRYESPDEADDDDRSESNTSPRKDNQDSDGLSGDGSITVTLTDPGVLDCSTCFKPLDVPVFQCKNGHLACSSCCIKLGNKCPSCSEAIGYNRCRALEKVIESVEVSCRNMKFGCEEAVSYSKKREHEEMCIYAPRLCPFPYCDFVESYKDLLPHFKSKHPGSVKYFRYDNSFLINLEMEKGYLILQEQDEYVIFILSNGIEILGNLLSVSCIGPITSKAGHTYELTARNGGRSVRLQSCTEKIIDYIPGLRVPYPSPKNFLLVPSDFVGSCGQLQLDLCIRHHEPPGC